MMATKKEASFEESLAELEEIVNRMETGEPSLADLMDNYSRGIRLSQKCMKALERAEKAGIPHFGVDEDLIHTVDVTILRRDMPKIYGVNVCRHLQIP